MEFLNNFNISTIVIYIMSIILPKELAYAPTLPSLPPDTTNTSIVVSPSNGALFNEQSIIQFDLPASGFLDPNTLYLRYNMNVSQTTAAGFLKATPAALPFFKLEILFGSQVVETITNYNMIYNMVTNLQMNVAQKVGCVNLGYINTVNLPSASYVTPTFDTANGCVIPWSAGTVSTTYSFGLPLMCLLTGAEKLIPLFAMPNVRIQLTVDSLSNMVLTPANTAANGSLGLLNNFELCYDKIDFGYGVEQMVKSMGEKVYIKSNSWATMSQTLASGVQNTNELIYNARYASIRSLFTNFAGNTAAKCLNGSFDSIDITSCNGDYQYFIAGSTFPNRPISTRQNKYGAMCELKMAINGGLHSIQAQNMAIIPREYNYTDLSVVTTGTNGLIPSKFWLGVNCEKFSSAGSLLSGVSTQNSAVSLRINLGTATAQAYNVTLIVLYDALIEIDLQMKDARVKQ
jgi:hypothetical protein